MTTTLNAATFVGKNFSTIQSVVKNHENLSLKQMFDVITQLLNNQEEINCLDKILYGKNSWTQLSLINDPVIINLPSKKVYVFSVSVFCLGKVFQHPECNEAWKNRLAGVRAERSYRDYDAINGESNEFECNIFPGFTTLQLVIKSLIYWVIGTNTSNFHSKNSIHVNVQGHLLTQKRQQRWMFKKYRLCEDICEKIWYWAMVIYWTKFWGKVVFFREQSTRSLWQHCGTDATTNRREWTSYISINDSIVQRKVEKQRKREGVHSLRCWSRYSWYNLSHYSFCQSAQCLRSSDSYMRGI